MAHFSFSMVEMRQNELRQILEPVIVGMGYELVGVEFHPTSANALLRVYIDKESGVNLDDCARVSHQISGVLDVEDAIEKRYTLEVSSPGLDRPLVEAKHFRSFAGRRIKVELDVPMDGRIRFTGLLKGIRDDEVVVEIEGLERLIPLNQIKKARLVPEL
jgi:ribosome maturation factor RimP